MFIQAECSALEQRSQLRLKLMLDGPRAGRRSVVSMWCWRKAQGGRRGAERRAQGHLRLEGEGGARGVRCRFTFVRPRPPATPVRESWSRRANESPVERARATRSALRTLEPANCPALGLHMPVCL